MSQRSLSIAFSDSLKEDVLGSVSNLAEVGLDAILDDGLLKEVPLLSTVVGLFKISGSIKERHNIRKLAVFLQAINNGIGDKQKRAEYQEKFRRNEKFRNQELEYIMVLIDRYIGLDKPQMLAKLYLAYLDGAIVWEEFSMYAEVIDRFLLLDYRTLVSEATTFHTLRDSSADSILRLVALGLMAEDKSITVSEARKTLKGEKRSAGQISSDSKKKKYKRTDFGRKLADILR